jgi:hypothetical protein
MTNLVLVAGGAAVLVAFGLWIRSRVVPTHRITLSQLPSVLAQLKASTATPAYAIFTFNSPDRPAAADALNLQFSIEEGRAGLDWVLVGPRNIADQQRFVEFATSAGWHPRLIESQRTSYLRVDQGELVHLCRAVIADLYKVPETATIEMIVAGFDWKG